MTNSTEIESPKEGELLLRFAREYWAQAHQGIPAKRLAKVVYLSDVVGRQYLGRPISAFRYYKWDYGPYDRAIKEVVRQLVAKDFARSATEWDQESRTIRLTAIREEPLADFSLGEREVIRYVTKSYLSMPIEELIRDVVYETEPMKQVRRKGDFLPMSVVDNERRNALGFDVEEILRAEEEIAAGNFSTDL